MAKKYLAILIAVLMVLSLVPVSVSAKSPARSNVTRSIHVPRRSRTRSANVPNKNDIPCDGSLYSEDFDGSSVSAYLHNADGNTATFGEGSSAIDFSNFKVLNSWGRSDTAGAVSFSYYTDGVATEASFDQDNWLMTTPFTIPDEEGYFLSYYASSFSSDENFFDHLEVYICDAQTADTDLNLWTGIVSRYVVPNTYTQNVVSLDAWAGQTVMILFRHKDYDKGALGIDNIQIGLLSEADPTPEPTATPEPTPEPGELAEGYVRVILTAHDVWGDGSGYQMLLDADAAAYGSTIPGSGALTASGNVDASVYDEFEFKIPLAADGVLTTGNIVVDGSYSIDIPAGVYDWCITNPAPGDCMWIASDNGNIGGRQDDYAFVAGCTYEFVVSIDGEYDAVDVTISGENAPQIPEIIAGYYFESDEEVKAFTILNEDSYNFTWERKTNASSAYEGTGYMQVHWQDAPHDWLIAPALEVPAINAKVTFYAKGQSSGFDETINVCVGAAPTAEAMTVVETFHVTNTIYRRFSVDLSAYAGQTVYVGIEYVGEDAYYIYLDKLEFWGNENLQPPAPATYTVAFVDGLTGSTISTVTVEEGQAAAAPDAPVHEGYTFVGWDSDFSNVTGDMTVTAHYQINTYTLTVYYLDVQGGKMAAPYVGTFTHGQSYSVTSPAVPGYTPDTAVVSGTMTADLTVIVTYTEDVPAGLPGDVDCNGVVNMADLALASSYVQNTATVTDQGVLNGDINGDGLLTIADLAGLYNIVLG